MDSKNVLLRMKYLVLIVLLLSYNGYSQSLYNARANDKVSYKDSERFTVSFEKTAYGITFERNDRVLNDALKTKIERFMKNTNRPKYKGLGTFTLDIVKRGDKYYVVENKSPEKLLQL